MIFILSRSNIRSAKVPQLALKCPHCRAEKIGFTYRSHAQVNPEVQQTLVFMQCEGCGQGIILVVNNNASIVAHWVQRAGASPGQILSSYPQPQALNAPTDIPDRVKGAFLSGLDNLARTGGANAAGAMFRRAIELAARQLDREAPAGITLKQRIERLPDTIVTPAMKDWAQHIRLEGNDAVHGPEEYSTQDAKDLHSFAELFLTYAFTLPEMLKKARPQTQTVQP